MNKIYWEYEDIDYILYIALLYTLVYTIWKISLISFTPGITLYINLGREPIRLLRKLPKKHHTECSSYHIILNRQNQTKTTGFHPKCIQMKYIPIYNCLYLNIEPMFQAIFSAPLHFIIYFIYVDSNIHTYTHINVYISECQSIRSTSLYQFYTVLLLYCINIEDGTKTIYTI